MKRSNKILLACFAVGLACSAKIIVVFRNKESIESDSELLSSSDYRQTFLRAGFVVPRRTIHGSVFGGLDEGNSKLPGVNVEAWAATRNADGVTYHSKTRGMQMASQKALKVTSGKTDVQKPEQKPERQVMKQNMPQTVNNRFQQDTDQRRDSNGRVSNADILSKQDIAVKEQKVREEEKEEEALNTKLKSELNLARAEYNRAKGGLDKSVGDYEEELRKQEALNAQLKAQLEAAQGASSVAISNALEGASKAMTESSATTNHDDYPSSNPYGVLARSPSEPHLVGGVLSNSALESGPNGVLARAPSDAVNVDGPLASTQGQPDSGYGLLGRVAVQSEDGNERENSRDAEGSLAEVVGHDGDAGGTLSAVSGDDMRDGVLDRVAPEPGSSGLLSLVPSSSGPALTGPALDAGTLSAAEGDDMAEGVLDRVASESTAGGVLSQVPSSDGPGPAENREAVDGALAGFGAEAGSDGPLGDMAPRGKAAVDGSLAGFDVVESADGPLGAVPQQGRESVDGSLAAVPSRAAERDGVLSAVWGGAVDGSLAGFTGNRGRDGSLAEVGRLGRDAIGGSLSGFPRSPGQDGILAEMPMQSRAAVDGSLAAVARPQTQETGPGQSPNQAAIDGTLAALPRSRSDRDGTLAGMADHAAATAGLLAAIPRSAGNRDGDLAAAGLAAPGQAAVDGPLAALADSATGRDGALAGLDSQNMDGVLARVRGTASREAKGGSLSMLRSRGGTALGLLGRTPADSDPVGVLAAVAARRRAWVAEQVRLHSLRASQAATPGAASTRRSPERVSASEVRRVKQWEKEVRALRTMEAHRLAALTAMEAAAKRDGHAAVAARSRAVAEEERAGHDAQVAATMRARAVVAAAARAAAGVVGRTAETASRKAAVAKPAAVDASSEAAPTRAVQAAPTRQAAHPRRIRRHRNPAHLHDVSAAAQLHGATAAPLHGAKLPKAARTTTQAAQTVRGAYRQLEESDEAKDSEAESKENADDDVGWVKRRWTVWGWTLFAVFGPVVTAVVTALVTVWAGPVAGVCTLVIMVSMDVCSYYYSWYTV